MTVNELQHIVKGIKYKKSIITLDHWGHDAVLKITTWVDDINTGDRVPVHMSMAYASEGLERMGRMSFLNEVHRLCRRWEEHECDEHFLVEGVRVFNPHKEDEDE